MTFWCLQPLTQGMNPIGSEIAEAIRPSLAERLVLLYRVIIAYVKQVRASFHWIRPICQDDDWTAVNRYLELTNELDD